MIIKKQNAKLTIVVFPWPGQIYRNDNNLKNSSIWKDWAIDNNVGFINASDIFFEDSKV